MGSFTSKEVVDEMIAKNGEHEPEDGPTFDVMTITEYTSPEGQTTWGVVYRCEIRQGLAGRYDEPTEYIVNPRRIFTRKERL